VASNGQLKINVNEEARSRSRGNKHQNRHKHIYFKNKNTAPTRSEARIPMFSMSKFLILSIGKYQEDNQSPNICSFKRKAQSKDSG
jgi:hypothetical protein